MLAATLLNQSKPENSFQGHDKPKHESDSREGEADEEHDLATLRRVPAQLQPQHHLADSQDVEPQSYNERQFQSVPVLRKVVAVLHQLHILRRPDPAISQVLLAADK